MGRPVVHFEILGREPGALRRYHGDLFGWTFETGDAASDEVSGAGQPRVRRWSLDGGINGGVGGGDTLAPNGRFSDPEGNLVGVAGVR